MAEAPAHRRVPTLAVGLGALAGYLGAALLFTLPMAFWIGDRCWGARFDFYTNLWFCWFLHRVVASGDLLALNLLGLATGLSLAALAAGLALAARPGPRRSAGVAVAAGGTAGLAACLVTSLPGHVEMLLYPVGEDFFFAYGHCFVELMSVPLQALWSLTVSYNLLSVLALGLSGFAGFLLCLHVTGSRSAAWIGGLFLECNNYLYSELTAGSVEVALVAGLPLYLLFYLRMLESGKWRDLLLAALALFLTAGANWLYGLMACLVTALASVWESARRRDLDPLLRSILVILLFLLAMTPYLVRMFEHVPARGRLDVAEMRSVAAYHARLGDGYEPLARYDFEARRGVESLEVYINSARLPNFLKGGLSYDPHQSAPAPLLWSLALLGAALGGRRTALWTAVAALSFLMSLGPFLRLSEMPPVQVLETDVKLPFYHLYNHAPLVSMIYRPYRFHALTLTALAVLVAVTWSVFAARVPHGRMRGLALFGAALFASNPLVLQPVYSAVRHQLPLASTDVPAWYRALAHEPGDFAVMDLPFYGLPPSLNQSRYIYYQTVHGKKILSTVFIRHDTVERFLELYRANSALRWIVDAGEGTFTEERIRATDVEWLLDQGYRYAVLHGEFDVPLVDLVNGSERKQAFDLRHYLGLARLFGPPRAHPGGLLVFEMETFRDLHRDREFVDPLPPGLEVPFLGDGAPVVVKRFLAPQEDLPLGSLDGLETVSFWMALGDGKAFDSMPVEIGLGGDQTLARLVLHPDRYTFVRLDLPPGTAGPLVARVPRERVGVDLVLAQRQGLVRTRGPAAGGPASPPGPARDPRTPGPPPRTGR